MEYTPINELHNLVVLDVTSSAPLDIDLDHWPMLQELRFDWNGRFVHLDAATELAALTVRSWKERDLELLAALPKLEVLELHGGLLQTLLGVEQFPLLRRLVLSRMRSLVDFEAITALENLSFLMIESCGKLNPARVDALGFVNARLAIFEAEREYTEQQEYDRSVATLREQLKDRLDTVMSLGEEWIEEAEFSVASEL